MAFMSLRPVLLCRSQDFLKLWCVINPPRQRRAVCQVDEHLPRKLKRPEPVGAFSFQRGLTFAIAGQQCWLLAAWATWQLIELFSGREAIALGLLVHDLRRGLTIARTTNSGFLTSRLVFTRRRATIARLVFTTSLAITARSVARAAALGRSACRGACSSASAGATAGTAAWSATTRGLTTWRRCGACGRSARATAATLLVLVRVGADVIGAVAKVVDLVIQKLVRCTISPLRRRLRLTCFAGRRALARFLRAWRTRRTFARGCGRCRFFLALVLAFVLATGTTAAAIW